MDPVIGNTRSDFEMDRPGTSHEGMVEVHYAYHVTGVKCNKGDDPPNFEKLKCGIASNTAYAGPLVGAPVVFFTTTLWFGDLPTMTPYPSNGDPGSKYWRVRVPLTTFNDFEIWECITGGPKQKHLILTTGDERKYVEGISVIKYLGTTDVVNPYLYRIENRWYGSRYVAGRDDFVNFAVFHDFSLFLCNDDPECPREPRDRIQCKKHCSWDAVERMSGLQGRGRMDSEALNDLLRENWTAGHLLRQREKQRAAEHRLCEPERKRRRSPSPELY